MNAVTWGYSNMHRVCFFICVCFTRSGVLWRDLWLSFISDCPLNTTKMRLSKVKKYTWGLKCCVCKWTKTPLYNVMDIMKQLNILLWSVYKKLLDSVKMDSMNFLAVNKSTVMKIKGKTHVASKQHAFISIRWGTMAAAAVWIMLSHWNQ